MQIIEHKNGLFSSEDNQWAIFASQEPWHMRDWFQWQSGLDFGSANTDRHGEFEKPEAKGCITGEERNVMRHTLPFYRKADGKHDWANGLEYGGMGAEFQRVLHGYLSYIEDEKHQGC